MYKFLHGLYMYTRDWADPYFHSPIVSSTYFPLVFGRRIPEELRMQGLKVASLTCSALITSCDQRWAEALEPLSWRALGWRIFGFCSPEIMGVQLGSTFPPTSKATINGLLYTHPATIDDGLLTINCWESPLARINWVVAQNSWNTYCPIRGN